MFNRNNGQLNARAAIAALMLMAVTALTVTASIYPFATPVYGLAASPDGSLLVADAGAGIVEIRNGVGSLIASLPGVTDVAPIGRGDMFAITSGGDFGLYRVSRGSTRLIADLGAFEAEVNPDGGAIDTNPFDVEVLNGGTALVADAAGNDLLIVDQKGKVDWVATLPNQVVPSSDLKQLIGCPNPPAFLAFLCDVPAQMSAEAVATSVAIGPDGAYYMGELKGFPAPTGMSRIWRIEPGTLHARCGTSPACRVVATGFTSIVDLQFGPDGTLYVVELDEASWVAVDLGLGTRGGTVNACDPTTWTCRVVATGLTQPMATAIGKDGAVHVATHVLIPGAADVITLH